MAKHGTPFPSIVHHGSPSGMIQVAETKEAQSGFHHDAGGGAGEESGDDDILEISDIVVYTLLVPTQPKAEIRAIKVKEELPRKVERTIKVTSFGR